MDIDFTGMDDAEVEAIRVSALAEIAARGERFQNTQQLQNVTSSLKNQGYSKDQVTELFTEVVEKVFPDAPPAEEPSV